MANGRIANDNSDSPFAHSQKGLTIFCRCKSLSAYGLTATSVGRCQLTALKTPLTIMTPSKIKAQPR